MKAMMSLIFLFTIVVVHAQQTVSWNCAVKKVDAKTYELHITAVIANGWHLYSQTTPDGGPLATTISFSKNPVVMLTGKVKEIGTMIKKHEEVFGVDVHYYREKVDFVQVVKLQNNVKTNVNGKVKFMVCDDERCLPPTEVPFTIKLQ